MAADGYILKIPKSVLTKLDSADEKIKKLAETSRATQSTVMDAFSKMAAGIDPFISQAKTADKALKTFGSKTNTSSVNNTASALARVAVEMNKVNKSSSANTAVLLWKRINEDIKVQQDRLSQLNRSIKDYEQNLARINSGKGGSISKADMAGYEANVREAEAVRKTIAAYELKQQRIIAYQHEQKRMADIINKSQGINTFSEEKKIAELQRLNEMYRNGTSELQKKAKAEDDAAKAAEKQAAANEKVAKAQERRNQAEQKQKERTAAKADREAAKAVEAYNNALNKSESTITQRLSKIEALRKAQEKLTATGRNYSKEIANISSVTARLQRDNQQAANSTDKLKLSQSKLLNTADQLKRKLALLFSVSAIQGYMEKLVKVRGEFELQQRSLQAIIQDKERADQVWDKTVKLAVRSPFTVKELVTYTKQLAAYRIETDKLYDTNKMLADVSAGLGVEMQRLILAYGQVKAANYLRGTELRQFSEAGVNMLGELATYFTELKGEMVSVGDVFDMVSKRAVKFADVEEVFRRITSEGGIFYNMQEIQAETLQGMMSNLQDSLDLMLNEIGKANDGVLKNLVTITKTLIDNWEILVNVLTAVASGYVVYTAKVVVAAYATNGFTAAMSKSLIASGGLAGIIGKLTLGVKGLTAALLKNPLFIIAAAAIYAYNEISRLVNKQKKIEEEYNTLTDSIGKQSVEVQNLTKKIHDYNEPLKKQTEILSKLKEGTDEYKKAEQDSNVEQAKRNSLLEELKSKYPSIYAGLVKQKDGTIDLTKATEEFNKALEYTNYLNWLAKQTGSVLSKNLRENIEEYTESFRDVNKLSAEVDNRWKQLNGHLKEYTLTQKNLSKETISQIEAITNSEESNSRKIAKLNKLLNTSNLGPLRDLLHKSIRDVVALGEATQKMEKNEAVLTEQIKQISKDFLLTNDVMTEEGRKAASVMQDAFIKALNISEKKVLEFVSQQFEVNIGVKINTNDAKNKYDGMQARIKKYIEDNKLSIDVILKDQSTAEYFKSLKSELKNTEEYIHKLSKATEPLKVGTTNAEEIVKAKKKIQDLTKILNAFGEGETKKQEESKAEKRLKAQISLLKKVGEEYKKNLQYYSKEEALAKTKKDYENSFNESGLGSKFLNAMDLEPQGIIDALDKIGKGAGSKMRFIIEKEISDLRGDVNLSIKVEGVEKTKRELDNLFSSYELTVELDKLGLTPDLIKNLFDVEPISLEGLENQLKNMFPDIEKLSEEELKVFKQSQEKIDKMRADSLVSNLKEYSKYLKKTVSARTLAELEAQNKIAEVQANSKLTPEQKTEIVKNIKDETQKKQNKIDIDEFKNSDVYSQMFKDVQNLGTATIERLKMVLDELKKSFGELNPEQLKEINSYYIQLENELIKRNPFEELQKSLKEVNRLEKEGRSEDFLNEELLSYQAQEKSLKEQISDLELIASMKEQGRELDILDAEFLERNKEIISLTTQELREQLKEKSNSLKGVQTNIGVTNKDLASYTKARKSLTELGNRIKTINNLSQNAFGSIKTILQSMGVSADSTEMIFADMGMNLVDLVAQAVMFSMQLKLMKMEAQLFGETLNAALGPIGWAVIALQALTSIFSAFSKAHDNKRQKVIDQEKVKVEELQRSYENLQKAIESGLSMDLYAKSNDRIELLKQQIKSYEAMIEAEADKKDADDGAIKGWKDDIQKVYDQINDIYDEMKESLLGTFKDISSTLGDAIVTAFEEGTSAAQAWGESVHDIVKNIVKQLVISKFVEPEVQKWFDRTYADMMPKTVEAQKRKEELDKANEALRLYDTLTDAEKIAANFRGGYAKLLKDQEEAQRAYDKAFKESDGEVPKLEEGAIKGYEESLDGLFDVINGRIPEWLEKYLSDKGSELSGLNQGISTISEDTAQALEALLNSMRFIVSDSNLALREITVLLGSDIGSNPLLAELRIQTSLIRSINDLFSSVVSPGHPTMGGFALKVIV